MFVPPVNMSRLQIVICCKCPFMTYFTECNHGYVADFLRPLVINELMCARLARICIWITQIYPVPQISQSSRALLKTHSFGRCEHCICFLHMGCVGDPSDTCFIAVTVVSCDNLLYRTILQRHPCLQQLNGGYQLFVNPVRHLYVLCWNDLLPHVESEWFIHGQL